MHIKTITNRNDIHSHYFSDEEKHLPKFRKINWWWVIIDRYGDVMNNYFGILNSLLINKQHWVLTKGIFNEFVSDVSNILSLIKNLYFQSFDVERTWWWRLSQKLVVLTKLNCCVLIRYLYGDSFKLKNKIVMAIRLTIHVFYAN